MMLTTRHVLLHRLTQERATLFHAIAFLPEEALTRRPAIGEWSVKDILGHVTAWEAEYVAGVEQFMGNERPHVLDIADIPAWNEEQASRRRDWPLEQVKQDMLATRQKLLDVLHSLPDDAFARPGPHPAENRAFVPWLINEAADHDREHWSGLMVYKNQWIAGRQGPVA